MLKEAALYCRGILKGIYEFDKHSTTQYKEWAVDAPGEYFAYILDDWRELYKEKLPMVSMKDFFYKPAVQIGLNGLSNHYVLLGDDVTR